jgi:hypothetical protein
MLPRFKDNIAIPEGQEQQSLGVVHNELDLIAGHIHDIIEIIKAPTTGCHPLL